MQSVRFCVFVALVPMLLSVSNAKAEFQSGTRLIDLDPVATGGLGLDKVSHKFSIGDRICYWGMSGEHDSFIGYRGGDSNEPPYAVYDIGNRFRSLRGWIGIEDGTDVKQGTFAISVDGQKVAYGQVQRGKVLPLNVDLTGGDSLRITLDDCCIGEPFLSSSVAFGGSVLAPRLLQPSEGATLQGNITLRWAAVNGATAYVVEVLSVKLESPDDQADRAICRTVHDGNSTTLGADKLAPGIYRWSVMAFDSQSVLGRFSAERSFVVKNTNR